MTLFDSTEESICTEREGAEGERGVCTSTCISLGNFDLLIYTSQSSEPIEMKTVGLWCLCSVKNGSVADY